MSEKTAVIEVKVGAFPPWFIYADGSDSYGSGVGRWSPALRVATFKKGERGSLSTFGWHVDFLSNSCTALVDWPLKPESPKGGEAAANPPAPETISAAREKTAVIEVKAGKNPPWVIYDDGSDSLGGSEGTWSGAMSTSRFKRGGRGSLSHFDGWRSRPGGECTALVDWPTKSESPPADTRSVADLISAECDTIKAMLLAKNKAYGNSALEPLRIASKATPIEQILVRIDDELSRLGRGDGSGNEDVWLDLLGYIVLLRVAQKLPTKEPTR